MRQLFGNARALKVIPDLPGGADEKFLKIGCFDMLFSSVAIL
jgi:hypothetical protein